MPLLRPVPIMALLIFCFVPFVRAQDNKTFPTDDEINLLLTQTDRAIQQYKPLIDQEEVLFGKIGDEAASKDRQVVQALEIAAKALKVNPQGFNGPGGFAFFEWLDDAARNALLCQSSAESQSTVYLMAGNTAKATELVHLSTSCMDVSTLLYTVSENAGALYERYIRGEEQLAAEGLKVSQKCADALKKMAEANKQKKQ
jgi:hypothetical protein